MEVSIIIPTRNRADKLIVCLDCLKKQSFKDFEVVIVDDGSIDNTKEKVREFKGLIKKYLYQEHSQQGVARNRGIDASKGKYIFFIGDDIFPNENWLEEHIKVLRANPGCAVLGLTLWPKDIEINDFMRYLAPNGPQFNYGLIKNNQNCGWGFFWTSNISLERNWFEQERFDENFRGWGYEDLELGYRLERKGMKIIFNPNAIAYHHHVYNDPNSFFQNQKISAKSAIYFAKKFPELKEILITNNTLNSKHKVLFAVFKVLPFLKDNQSAKPYYWKLQRRHHFNEGLKEDYTANEN